MSGVRTANEKDMVEDHVIEVLTELGYEHVPGEELTPENGERESYRQVILKERFIRSVLRLNPWLTDELVEQVYKKVTELAYKESSLGMKEFYDMLVNGVKVKVRGRNGERTRLVRLIDLENPDNNEFLVADQFTVEFWAENNLYRRPDVVVFINGIPLAVFEVKGENSNETAKDAFQDHVDKKKDIPQLYLYSQVLVVSDGLETRYGSPTSGWERFFFWEGIESDDDLEVVKGIDIDDESIPIAYRHRVTGEPFTSVEVLLRGLFDKRRFLEYLSDFILHEQVGSGYIKKIAMYHQFYTVKKAIERTVRAVQSKNVDDKRIGTVWHTQGSGKSLTMLFYARKALKTKELENPLLLFITDRRELDEQLHGVFSRAMKTVDRAESIRDLRRLLSKKSGGVVFSTIQKFGRMFDRFILTTPTATEKSIEMVKSGGITRGISLKSMRADEEERDTGFIQVGPLVVGEAVAKKVTVKKLSEITDDDIKGTGFSNVGELIEFLKRELDKEPEKKLMERKAYIVDFEIIDWYDKFTPKVIFYPVLNERHNIIVIADEAHRSQYRDLAKNLRKALPNAAFMGFTATPVEYADRSTPLTFGDYISIYSMDIALRHRVVVPIFYESRLLKLHLTNHFIDEEFDEISERIVKDPDVREELKKKFATLEKLILSEDRLKKIAEDIVTHFNKRNQTLKGKAMVVTISRRVAVELYKHIEEYKKRVGLKEPTVAVVISGSKSRDPPEFKPHIRSKKELNELALSFKNPDSDPQMVIVVDMWLTGFDVPPLHTMYFDKPMKNHSLMQAIARVNRVFGEKSGGLIVDYIGIADDLRKSLSLYISRKGEEPMTNVEKVIDLLREKYDVVSSYLSGIDYKNWRNLSRKELTLLTAEAYDRIAQKGEEAKKQFVKEVVALKKLYSLASPHPITDEIRDDLIFFEMIKRMVVKYQTRNTKDLARQLERDITSLISKSIVADEPIDIFEMLRMEKPDISLLSEDFLKELLNYEHKNYVVDVITKIIHDQLRVRMRRNPYRYKSLYEKLNELIDKYNRRIIEVSEVIAELVEIAKETRKAMESGKNLNMTEEELAFYDLLLAEGGLPENYEIVSRVAKEIAKTLSGYVTVADWKNRSQVRAKIKNELKRILMSDLGTFIRDYNQVVTLSEQILKQAEVIFEENVRERT